MKAKYWRKGSVTGTFDDGGKMTTTANHASINKAKKQSRALQGGQRGTGILVVIR